MRSLVLTGIFGLTLACAPAAVDILLDTDQDGLLNETEYGSDPQNPDSDGDGWADGFEVSQDRDPMDPNDHPYTGGWLVDADCNDEIVSTGNSLGDTLEDFVLLDQFGEEFRFHDFCNRAIMIEMSGFS
jgi:hypothetical protein